MNNITDQALMSEVNKLKTAHNALVTKAGGDLDAHAEALRQIAVGLNSLAQRVARLEQSNRPTSIPAQQVSIPGAASAPTAASAPAVASAAAPAPAVAPQPMMSQGWADDEEEAEFEEG